MILWLTGNTQAGKTTLAKKLMGKNTINLDGDDLRGVWAADLTPEGRRQHCMQVAKLAALLESQGFAIIVSVIAPFEDLRRDIQTLTGCNFVYIPGGKEGKEYPYEIPEHPVMVVDKEKGT